MSSTKYQAPEGKIWVCIACGKVSSDRYGNSFDTSSGWDESCFINSILLDKNKLVFNKESGRVVEIKNNGE